jgi:hypothetical protein
LANLQDQKLKMALYNCSWEAWSLVDVEELGRTQSSCIPFC